MTDNAANKEDALKCVAIARRAMAEGDIEKADKFSQKALRLFICKEATDLALGIEAMKASGTHAAHAAAADGADDSGQQTEQSDRETSHKRAEPAGPPAGRAGHESSAGPAGMGGSSRHGQSVPHRRKAAHAAHTHVEPEVDENAGTPEQRQQVKAILQSKDLYEILGLARAATDDDIKKAYRKTALKLHPDKCKAAHAEEAFKAVSKAFSCLSDPDKRAYYDRTGYESSAAASAAAAQQRSRGGGGATVYRTGPAGMYYAEDFDPDEIFNMFFGGGGLHAQMFRAQMGGMQRRAQQQQHPHPHQVPRQPQTQTQRALMGLVQLLPVLLMLLFGWLTGSHTPKYSLFKDSKYTEQLVTSRLAVPYFVMSKDEFERGYPTSTTSRSNFEHQVESDYYERLAQKCEMEQRHKQRLMYGYRTRAEAQTMKLPSCDEMSDMRQRLHQQGIRA